MPPQILARMELINGFRRGENGWGEGASNPNFNKLSSLIHISVKQIGRTSPLSNDPVGTAYIVASANLSGDFVGHAGDVAYKDLTHPAPVSGTSPAKWYFQTPFTGMLIYNESDNALYVYDNGWVVVRPPAIWCRRYLGSSQNAVGGTADINFTSAESGADAQGLYNTSGKYLRIPEAGVYDIRLHAYNTFAVEGGSSVGNANFWIYNGSTIVSTSTQFSEPTYNRALIHNCQYLGRFATGDRVYFKAGTGAGSQVMIINAGLSNTYFDCKKVGN